ncbi:NAD(P)H-quinone dehydrogenase [Actinocrinis puniceicyclus]|uniref:NAD(P)H dehydrogenase (quinone) n=1 Tax=Actinocrinis puniceicyclus TaxID=977794 RepID=A0A8J7WL75_9ACTN|nr:NAD(P)H-quinone dehydrogenase [Actinocrinis puniceicyclus]MBS2961772.1 NAD(P)H-quinone dehydrogenase [Actinocrinis puniceicyclus]
MTRIAIIGGGPGGYEAALVAARLGAEVTIVDRDGIGGAAVLTDCVPSKTLIATADVMAAFENAPELGVRVGAGGPQRATGVDLARVNARVKALALKQSEDIAEGLAKAGVIVVRGTGRLADGGTAVEVITPGGALERIAADAVIVATGARPRELPSARPDGERILTWTQLYDLDELPEDLIVVGSGVTGVEFAGAYQALGSRVTLVSSRERVLPGEDEDAARVLEEVFQRRGMRVLSRSRAASVTRDGDHVTVTLEDGRTVRGTHCLMAVGSLPNTDDLGLAEAGVQTTSSGHIVVDRVSRTTAAGVYAAGDCTGLLLLASVAAMQGRIAVYHALGEAVWPINLKRVSSNIFTAPEIATVGRTSFNAESDDPKFDVVKLPLNTNPRAKMLGFHDGFVKLYARPGSGTILGGVIVSPRASELIHPIALAVDVHLTVDQVASVFTVYPSLSGSVAEAARRLHRDED